MPLSDAEMLRSQPQHTSYFSRLAGRVDFKRRLPSFATIYLTFTPPPRAHASPAMLLMADFAAARRGDGFARELLRLASGHDDGRHIARFAC